MSFGFEGSSSSGDGVQLNVGQVKRFQPTGQFTVLHYDVTTEFEGDSGIVFLKPQVSGSKNRKVRVQNISFTRTVTFNIVTLGEAPSLIPSPEPLDDKETLLYRKVILPSPSFSTDATPTFAVAGIYIFERDEPYDSDRALEYRHNPTGIIQQDYKLETSNFVNY